MAAHVPIDGTQTGKLQGRGIWPCVTYDAPWVDLSALGREGKGTPDVALLSLPLFTPQTCPLTPQHAQP